MPIFTYVAYLVYSLKIVSHQPRAASLSMKLLSRGEDSQQCRTFLGYTDDGGGQ
jgi:hypothetical protein